MSKKVKIGPKTSLPRRSTGFGPNNLGPKFLGPFWCYLTPVQLDLKSKIIGVPYWARFSFINASFLKLFQSLNSKQKAKLASLPFVYVATAFSKYHSGKHALSLVPTSLTFPDPWFCVVKKEYSMVLEEDSPPLNRVRVKLEKPNFDFLHPKYNWDFFQKTEYGYDLCGLGSIYADFLGHHLRLAHRGNFSKG